VTRRDLPRFDDYAEMAAGVARLDRVSPNFGAQGTMVPFTLACVGWPVSVDNPPRPLPQGLAPILGVGAWGDFPATSRVVAEVSGSGLVFHDGSGHELYATNNACVIAYVDAYFTSRVMPPRGAIC
jgi:TAP-like protein